MILLLYSALNFALASSPGWWVSLGDSNLTELIEIGLAESPDLAVARARIAQAESVVGQSRAGLLPAAQLGFNSNSQPADALGFGFGFESIEELIPDIPEGLLPPAEETETEEETENGLFTSTSLNLQVNVPLDVWGMQYNGYQAALSDADGSADQAQHMANLLSSSIAQVYFDLVAAKSRKRVTQEQLASWETLLASTNLRHARGDASVLEVLQQEQQKAAAEAQLPLLIYQIQRLTQQVNVLLGRPPQTALSVSHSFATLVDSPLTPPVSNWMTGRGDIRAAEATLAAAKHRQRAATKVFLPTLSVGGQLSRQANLQGDEWDNLNTWNVTSGGQLTLFQGGGQWAALQGAAAGVHVAEENLRKTNLVVTEELLSAQSQDAAMAEQWAARTLHLDAANRAHKEALSAYSQGTIPFSTLLSTHQAQQLSQLTWIQAQRDRWVARVHLLAVQGGAI